MAEPRMYTMTGGSVRVPTGTQGGSFSIVA